MPIASDGTYSTETNLASGLPGGEVTVSVRGAPELSVTSPLCDCDLPPAVTVAGVLHTKSVYCDEPSIDMSFQVSTSDTLSTKTDTAKVDVMVSPRQGQRITPLTETLTCAGGSASGVCRVSFSVESACARLRQDEDLVIKYKLASSGASEWASLEGARLHQPAAKINATTVDTVYAVVPSKPVYPGRTFVLEIRSRYRLYLKSAAVTVKIGRGLELVSGSARFPKSGEKRSVFASTRSQYRSSTEIYIVTGQRQDGKTAVLQKNPTDELLFSVTVRVKVTTKVGPQTVQVTQLTGLLDLVGVKLTPSAVGVIASRDGVVINNPANVYVAENSIVGMFGYTEESSELFNTAVISAKSVQVSTTAVVLRVLDAITPKGITCRTKFTSAMSVYEKGERTGCTVVLSGAETTGAPRATVIMAFKGVTAEASLRIFYPGNISLASNLPTLHPVVGWLDESDSTCERRQYQRAYVTAVATFADGDGVDAVFRSHDVTDLVQLKSSNTAIATIGGGEAMRTVRGKSPGGSTVTVSAVGAKGRALGQGVDIYIAEDDEAYSLRVMRLEASVISSLGYVTATCERVNTRPVDDFGPGDATNTNSTGMASMSSAPGSAIDTTALGTGMSRIFFSPHAPCALQKESDSMHVIVSAVLEDWSRVELNAEAGLVLSSNNKESVTTEGLKLVVPNGAKSASGQLVNVRWDPRVGACKGVGIGVGKHAEQDIFVTVSVAEGEEDDEFPPWIVPFLLCCCFSTLLIGGTASYTCRARADMSGSAGITADTALDFEITADTMLDFELEAKPKVSDRVWRKNFVQETSFTEWASIPRISNKDVFETGLVYITSETAGAAIKYCLIPESDMIAQDIESFFAEHAVIYETAITVKPLAGFPLMLVTSSASEGMNDSKLRKIVYQNRLCSKPTIEQTEGGVVIISCTTADSALWYTVNGEDPNSADPSSNAQMYDPEFPITLDTSLGVDQYVRAIAIYEGAQEEDEDEEHAKAIAAARALEAHQMDQNDEVDLDDIDLSGIEPLGGFDNNRRVTMSSASKVSSRRFMACQKPLIQRLPEGGIKMTCNTQGALIWYNINSDAPNPRDPSSNTTVYASTVNLDTAFSQHKIQAVATKEGRLPSKPVALEIAMTKMAPPQIHRMDGDDDADGYLITHMISSATIMYLIERVDMDFDFEDDAEDLDVSKSVPYTGVITLSTSAASTWRIVAWATQSGKRVSEAVEHRVNILKLPKPAVRVAAGSSKVTMSVNTTDQVHGDVEIYYSIGADSTPVPGAHDTFRYKARRQPEIDFTHTPQVVFKAMAISQLHESSDVVTATFQPEQAPVPIISPFGNVDTSGKLTNLAPDGYEINSSARNPHAGTNINYAIERVEVGSGFQQSADQVELPNTYVFGSGPIKIGKSAGAYRIVTRASHPHKADSNAVEHRVTVLKLPKPTVVRDGGSYKVAMLSNTNAHEYNDVEVHYSIGAYSNPIPGGQDTVKYTPSTMPLLSYVQGQPTVFKAIVVSRVHETSEVAVATFDVEQLPAPMVVPIGDTPGGNVPRFSPEGYALQTRASREGVIIMYAVQHAEVGSDFHESAEHLHLPNSYVPGSTPPIIINKALGFYRIVARATHIDMGDSDAVEYRVTVLKLPKPTVVRDGGSYKVAMLSNTNAHEYNDVEVHYSIGAYSNPIPGGQDTVKYTPSTMPLLSYVQGQPTVFKAIVVSRVHETSEVAVATFDVEQLPAPMVVPIGDTPGGNVPRFSPEGYALQTRASREGVIIMYAVQHAEVGSDFHESAEHLHLPNSYVPGSTPPIIINKALGFYRIVARATHIDMGDSDVSEYRVTVHGLPVPSIVPFGDASGSSVAMRLNPGGYEIKSSNLPAGVVIKFVMERTEVGSNFQEPACRVNLPSTYTPGSSGPIIINKTAGTYRIVARATDTDMVDSDVAEFLVNVLKLPKPGLCRDEKNKELVDMTTNVSVQEYGPVEVYYSSGFQPTNPVPGELHTTKFSSGNKPRAKDVLCAVNMSPYHETSAVASASFEKPCASPPVIHLGRTSKRLLVIQPSPNDAGESVQLFYTLNGTVPTTSSTRFASGAKISLEDNAVVVKAIAYIEGRKISDIVQAKKNESLLREINDEVMKGLGRSCPKIKVNLLLSEIKILEPILFEVKKYSLQSKGGSNPQMDQNNEAVMAQVAKAMAVIYVVCDKWKLPQLKFEIGGHTNAKDPAKQGARSQMMLSEDRAQACMKSLMDRHVDADMVKAVGHGGLQRIAEGNDEETAKNQRVEITMVSPLDKLLEAARLAGVGTGDDTCSGCSGLCKQEWSRTANST